MSTVHVHSVPKRDESQEASRQVEQITDNKPVCGETLLRSGQLKKKLQDARAWSHRQAQKSQLPENEK
jgi:hypothetical protein